MMFDTGTLQTLPDLAIDRAVLGERRTLEIHVHSTLERTHNHRCGTPIDHHYALGQESKLGHLPVFDYNTVLALRPKRSRLRSREGRPTTSEALSCYTPRASVTKAFEGQMLLELINNTLEDVSLKYPVGVDSLQGVLEKQAKTARLDAPGHKPKLRCFDRYPRHARDPLQGNHELFRWPPAQWLCRRAQQ